MVRREQSTNRSPNDDESPHVIQLKQGEKSLDLPALEPSDGLRYAYQCAQLISQLIDRGDLKPTRQDADRWMGQHPDNRTKFDAAKRLLMGYEISEYVQAYQARYIQEIDERPEGRAAHVIVKDHLGRGWTVSGLDPVLIMALSK